MKHLHLAVYDFDGTLYPNETLTSFWKWSLKHRFKAWVFLPHGLFFVFLYGLKLISKQNLKENFMQFISRKTLKNDLDRFWKTQKCFPWVRSRFKKDKQLGRTIVCISASADFFLESLSKKLGWDVLIASPTRKTNPLRFSAPNAQGKQKVIYLNDWAQKKGITYTIETMFSDRLIDKPLLDLATEKFTVPKSGKYYKGYPKN